VSKGGVPTETILRAVETEGSPEQVARLYEVPLGAVSFEQQLAA
jgi:hypothetical protein